MCRDPYFDSHEHKVHVNLLNFEHNPRFAHRIKYTKWLLKRRRHQEGNARAITYFKEHHLFGY